jgi:hypothetical protein
MQILFVTEELIRFSVTMVRGGQIHIRNVVEGLRDRGHDAHLTDWNSDPDDRFSTQSHPVLGSLMLQSEPSGSCFVLANQSSLI